MSVTVNTGAQVSIVPIECVEPSQMVGRKMKVRSFQGSLVEGEACIVNFKFGGRVFEREAVAVEGSLINWTPCFQVSFSTEDDLDFLRELARERQQENGEQLYVQPRMKGGKLQTGYMVSGDDVVEREMQTPSIPVSVAESGRAVKIDSDNNDIATAEAELRAIDLGEDSGGEKKELGVAV